LPKPQLTDLGANFFFMKYSFAEEPVFVGYHDWLTSLYLDGIRSPALCAAIEAVGLAGLSNISYARYLQQHSRKQYGKALAMLKQALDDSALVYADETLVTVILLILFEAQRPFLGVCRILTSHRWSTSKTGRGTIPGQRMSKLLLPFLRYVDRISSPVIVADSYSFKVVRR
jgi:hypothetical protein